MAGVDSVDERAVVDASEVGVELLKLDSSYVLGLYPGLVLYGGGDSVVEDWTTEVILDSVYEVKDSSVPGE